MNILKAILSIFKKKEEAKVEECCGKQSPCCKTFAEPEVVVEEPKAVVIKEKMDVEDVSTPSNAEDLNTQKIILSKETGEHQISALSLKSIMKKRELEASINPVQINQEDLPNDHFTFEELKQHWDFCSNQYYATGRMLMSSTMNMANLTLSQNKILDYVQFVEHAQGDRFVFG